MSEFSDAQDAVRVLGGKHATETDQRKAILALALLGLTYIDRCVTAFEALAHTSEPEQPAPFPTLVDFFY